MAEAGSDGDGDVLHGSVDGQGKAVSLEQASCGNAGEDIAGSWKIGGNLAAPHPPAAAVFPV